ncbi:unnamed protein product [Protopolystoma xenopodis]|uniref:Uncharacterized protein n=1 Tax=Protopolystoma xenopodis TaxID=117903 RepID=A0A3S5AC01_9PLAT|nr:unnamed protein product [Protopolystoma xenopodis]
MPTTVGILAPPLGRVRLAIAQLLANLAAILPSLRSRPVDAITSSTASGLSYTSPHSPKDHSSTCPSAFSGCRSAAEQDDSLSTDLVVSAPLLDAPSVSKSNTENTSSMARSESLRWALLHGLLREGILTTLLLINFGVTGFPFTKTAFILSDV